MVVRRTCKTLKADHQPCAAAPLVDGDYCLMHDPEHAEEAAEARRLGGQRRRRERVVAGAYDYEGLDSAAGIRRIVQIAVSDTLGMENGVQRNRTLISAALAAAKLLETGELEERLRALEAAVGPRLKVAGRTSR